MKSISFSTTSDNKHTETGEGSAEVAVVVQVFQPLPPVEIIQQQQQQQQQQQHEIPQQQQQQRLVDPPLSAERVQQQQHRTTVQRETSKSLEKPSTFTTNAIFNFAAPVPATATRRQTRPSTENVRHCRNVSSR